MLPAFAHDVAVVGDQFFKAAALENEEDVQLLREALVDFPEYFYIDVENGVKLHYVDQDTTQWEVVIMRQARTLPARLRRAIDICNMGHISSQQEAA